MGRSVVGRGQRYRQGERVLLFLYPQASWGSLVALGGEMGRYAIDPRGRVVGTVSQDMTMNNRVASTVRSLLLRLARTVAIFFVFAPLSRAGGPNCVAGDGGGETKSGNPAMPVILRVTQCSAASDVNGLANIVPSSSGFSGPLEVDVAVTTGINASLDYPLQFVAPPASTTSTKSPPVARRIRAPLEMKKERSNPDGNWDRVDAIRD